MNNFIHFHIIILFTSLCKAQVQYFINCGSSSNTTINTGQTFVGDEHSNIVTFTSPHTSTLNSPNQPNTPSQPIYQTARIFKTISTYNFNIPQNGTYVIRLHFCAFSSSLSNANFNVYTSSGLMLLPDFVPDIHSSNCSSVTPKEFVITISNNGDKFRLYFAPISSSLAFVNAIEIFNTTSYTRKFSVPYVTPSRSNGNYSGKDSQFFETIHRINVGGSEVEPSSDILWRKWIPDDQYMINKFDAQNTIDKSSAIVYASGFATIDDGPPQVYGTAKELRTPWDSNVSIPNLMWQFSVEKNTEYFVRVHFCDILSNAVGYNNFTLYFYSNFSEVIYPYYITEQTDTPFCKEYVVGSDDSGLMNISVGPNNASQTRTYMFLNGLEIMQVKNETAIIGDIPKNSSHMVLIVSVVVPSVVLVVFMAGFLFYLYQKKKSKKKLIEEWAVLPLTGMTSSQNRTSEIGSSRASTFQNLQLGLKIPFSEIQRVTNNFDPNLIIGEGGFGKVYMGTLRSGFKVAVKRGSPDHGQGIAEFQTEIMILSKIRHRHLVSLIGYCYENGEMILVYEFMEKGTLRKHLYESKRGNNSSSTTNRQLSWKQRLEICIGAAKGIQYLHTGTNTGIIHRDVKSTNILLDENFVAKVADFGLSRSGYLDQSHVSISDVKGTLGYLDPEYVICLQLTEKSDVYAFGVVLLEALCARPVIDTSLPREEVNLPEWALACYYEGEIERIIDPSIMKEINPNSLKKFCETALRCLDKDAGERPAMSDVCWGLEYALQFQKSGSEGRVPLDDSTTNASLNMTLPVIQRFPSQTIDDFSYNDELLETGSTGEVFSQLNFSDNVGR